MTVEVALSPPAAEGIMNIVALIAVALVAGGVTVGVLVALMVAFMQPAGSRRDD
jgi:hypothetical protein